MSCAWSRFEPLPADGRAAGLCCRSRRCEVTAHIRFFDTASALRAGTLALASYMATTLVARGDLLFLQELPSATSLSWANKSGTSRVALRHAVPASLKLSGDRGCCGPQRQVNEERVGRAGVRQPERGRETRDEGEDGEEGGGVGTEIISDSASAPKQTADFLAQPPSQVVGADLAW